MKGREIEDIFWHEDGIIRSAGEFEGQALYMPHFWTRFMGGGADDDVAARDQAAFRLLRRERAVVRHRLHRVVRFTVPKMFTSTTPTLSFQSRLPAQLVTFGGAKAIHPVVNLAPYFWRPALAEVFACVPGGRIHTISGARRYGPLLLDHERRRLHWLTRWRWIALQPGE